jgi:hypothetical protein
MIQVFAVILTQLSIGSLLFAAVAPVHTLRASFFTLNSLIGALAAALAFTLTKVMHQATWWEMRYLGLTVIGATIAFGLFRLEKRAAGRLFMILSGFVGLVFGLVPLAGKVLASRGIETKAPFLFDAGILSGTVLLGTVNVAMILGHWYLVMRGMSFEYLERFTLYLIGAVGLRLVVIVGVLTLLRPLDPNLASTYLNHLWAAEGNLMFMVLRLLFGIALPGVLAVMAYRCVKEEANQAATGLLYVAEVSVLFGELIAAYLLV